MQTVEIAHRQHRTALVVREGAGMSNDSDHGNLARRRFIGKQLSRK
jgi:hypothetical protein